MPDNFGNHAGGAIWTWQWECFKHQESIYRDVRASQETIMGPRPPLVRFGYAVRVDGEHISPGPIFEGPKTF
jgi:hypothetical protein